MLIKEDEVSKRLNNPLNLINQMKNNKKNNEAMALFIPSINKPIKTETGTKAIFNPFDKAGDVEAETKDISTDELVSEGDAKIKLALAHDRALEVMTRAISVAGLKLDDIKADKLPGVIVAMSKVVGSIRQERIERDKVNKGNDVHLHFYCPEQKKIEQYQVIEVTS